MSHVSFKQGLLATAVSVGLLGLAACTGERPELSKASDLNLRPQIELVRLAYTLQPESDGTDTPSLATLDDFYAFLEETEAGYGDQVVFDTGDGVAPERIDRFARFVKARGLEYGGVAALGAAPERGEIAVYLERYVVLPPECGAWVPEATRDRRNETSAHWACASVRNLALMVASPRDLIEGQRGAGNGNAVIAIERLRGRREALQTGGDTANLPLVNAGASGGGVTEGGTKQ